MAGAAMFVVIVHINSCPVPDKYFINRLFSLFYYNENTNIPTRYFDSRWLSHNIMGVFREFSMGSEEDGDRQRRDRYIRSVSIRSVLHTKYKTNSSETQTPHRTESTTFSLN